jgi:predicted metal-dependent HD superfamily phosphohydrolase
MIPFRRPVNLHDTAGHQTMNARLPMQLEYTPHTERLKVVDAYIRNLFKDELPESIKYHDADHTLHPTKGVVAVANRLAVQEKVPEKDRELVVTAAYFHDAGFIREYVKNEPIAARMAGRILKLIGYDPEEIRTIQSLILATDPNIQPKTHLEKIIRDADLDNLGREDFFEMDEKLRQGELSKGGEVNNDSAWRKRTIEFMENHEYYTESQRIVRNPGKKRNLEKLLHLLKRSENPK